jgi:homoserine kinase
MGPGFDCLGLALSLRNRVELERLEEPPETPLSGMLAEAGDAFFSTTGSKPFPFALRITGEVPQARGLGSSVTVRAGILAGLNKLAGDPLSEAECLNLVIALEGHPDNAAPAVLGGFCVCTQDTIAHFDLIRPLRAAVVIPSFEVATADARKALPDRISFADAITNVAGSSLLAVALATGQYELARGEFADHLHQPYRTKLVPMLHDVIEAGEGAGALGGFLSGSGSSIICLVHGAETTAAKVAKAMLRATHKSDPAATSMVLAVDNKGISLRAHP